MAWPEIRVANFAEYMAAVAGKTAAAAPYLFRGQGNAAWLLTPSLVRELKGKGLTAAECLGLERGAVNHFRLAAHLYHDPIHAAHAKELFGCWALMQHFGVPTRMLDWTSSPFIALYFAIERSTATDGAVWVVDRQAAATAVATVEGDASFPPPAGREAAFLEETAARHLYFVRPDEANDRLNAQKGWFSLTRCLLCEHDSAIEGLLAAAGTAPAAALLKIIVPAGAKMEMLRVLAQFDVTAERLFPGRDGHGRSVSEFVRLGVFELERRTAGGGPGR